MADLKISQLTQVITPTVDDILPIVNSAETKRVTFGNFNSSLPITSFVSSNSALWSRSLDSAKMSINGNVGLANTLNNTEYIVNWNSLDYQTDSSVIEANITNDNMIIKQTGNYLINLRYSSYDLTNDVDYLRIRLRGQVNVPITSTSGGTLLETIDEGFINLDSTILGFDVNGRATKGGALLLRVTTVPYYLVATIFHQGGSASVGTAGFPVFENSSGTLPYFIIQKIT
jgi:hypothetical protein